MRKEYDFSQGQRGPVVPAPPGQVRITIRLDADILQWFREQVNAGRGGNYQTMINDALRARIQSRNQTPGRNPAPGDSGRTPGSGLNGGT